MLSKLGNLFRPIPDVNIAYNFGCDVAYEFLVRYDLIDKDPDAVGISKFEKYVLIVFLDFYQDNLVNDSKFSDLVDKIERGSFRPIVSSFLKTEIMSTCETTARELINHVEKSVAEEGREFNFADVVGSIAWIRFSDKYGEDGADHDRLMATILAAVEDVIPSNI